VGKKSDRSNAVDPERFEREASEAVETQVPGGFEDRTV
jgi:hypothetical protein